VNANKRFGVVASYVHPGAQLGVLIEVCIENLTQDMLAAARDDLRHEGEPGSWA
jgi:hypothetical protein